MTHKTQKATHSGFLDFGDFKVSCAVLEDGTRVIVDRSMATVIGIKGSGRYWEEKKKGGDVLPEYISARYLQPFITKNQRVNLSKSITYLSKSGKEMQGVKAEILPEICDIWIKLGENGANLTSKQKKASRVAFSMLKGFAVVGISALVDEATGYQDVRSRDALQAILDQYLLKEFATWAKRFPDEFYKEMFRLKGWEWRGMKVNRPSVVGRYTNNLVYERVAPGILEELQARNPKNDSGKRKVRHHQFLTEDIGHQALAQHLHAVIGFMRASTTWENFMRMMNRAFPKKGQQLDLFDNT